MIYRGGEFNQPVEGQADGGRAKKRTARWRNVDAKHPRKEVAGGRRSMLERKGIG